MSDGQLAINTNDGSPGLFFKDSNSGLIKVGPVHVGTTAPNVSPATGGTAGNSKGELWLDTTNSDYTLKTWDGSAWREIVVTSAMIKNGEIVNADVNTSAAIAGTKISPDFGSQNVVTTGTSTAASFIPSGSSVPTNGVYLPAANTVAISSSGQPRFVVIGNVCTIGAADAATAGIEIGFNPSGNRNSYIDLIGDQTYTDYGGRLIRGDTGANTNTSLIHRGTGELRLAATDSGTIAFLTANSERARIDSTGRLGLGTSSPDATLTVNGSSTVSSQVNVSARIGPNVTSDVLIGSINGNTPFIASQGAYPLALRTNATTALTIDSSQRVGIGTTSPGYSLHVNGSCAVAGDKNLRLGEGSFTYYYDLGREASTGKFVFDGNQTGVVAYSFRKGGTNLVDIDNSGRLLVGTSTAVAALTGVTPYLQVQGTAENAYVSIGRWTASANNPGFVFNKSRGASVGTRGLVSSGDNLGAFSFTGDDGTKFVEAASIFASVDGTPGADDMPGRLVFATTADSQSSPTERVRIDSSGRVGIGTTAPGSTLTVNGTTRIQNTASFVGINIKNDNDSSSVTTTSFIDASNNLGTIDGHLFFEHLPSGGSSAYIATTPAGDRTIDRRVTRLTVGFNGTTTVNSAASTAPFIALINGAESVRIDSSGRLLVGTSSAYTVQGFNRSHYFNPISGENNNQMVVSALGTGTPGFFFTRTRGSTPTTYTVVQDGDNLGILEFFGADGSSYGSSGARITCQVDGTPGTNDMPGRLVFATTADSQSSPTERVRIDSSGRVGIGTSSPGSTLDVKGTVRLSGSTSGYVGLAPAAAAGSTTYTLPTADGSSGQVLSTNGSGILSWATRTEIPSGTLMLFAQTNAPTGWTKSTTHDNKALRVVSGTAGSGGSAAFTTAFASRTPSGSVSGTNSSGAVQPHTLGISQIPSHTHTYVESFLNNDSEDGNGTEVNTGGFLNNTGAAGGGLSHDHSFVNPSWSGTFTGSAMDFAVAYVDVIIATKN